MSLREASVFRRLQRTARLTSNIGVHNGMNMDPSLILGPGFGGIGGGFGMMNTGFGVHGGMMGFGGVGGMGWNVGNEHGLFPVNAAGYNQHHASFANTVNQPFHHHSRGSAARVYSNRGSRGAQNGFRGRGSYSSFQNHGQSTGGHNHRQSHMNHQHSQPVHGAKAPVVTEDQPPTNHHGSSSYRLMNGLHASNDTIETPQATNGGVSAFCLRASNSVTREDC